MFPFASRSSWKTVSRRCHKAIDTANYLLAEPRRQRRIGRQDSSRHGPKMTIFRGEKKSFFFFIFYFSRLKNSVEFRTVYFGGKMAIGSQDSRDFSRHKFLVIFLRKMGKAFFGTRTWQCFLLFVFFTVGDTRVSFDIRVAGRLGMSAGPARERWVQPSRKLTSRNYRLTRISPCPLDFRFSAIHRDSELLVFHLFFAAYPPSIHQLMKGKKNK